MNDSLKTLSSDAQTLAWLHHQEPGAALIAELKAINFPHNLALLPQGQRGREMWTMMSESLAALPAGLDRGSLDELAADYAAIYCNGSLGASPCESAWTDPDQLVCQSAMFELREIYCRAGLVSANWRVRADDHLVLQLAYVAHALEKGDEQHLANFLDEHLLYWLPDFAERVAHRCATPFFAALALVTMAWVEELREVLPVARPSRQQIESRKKARAAAEEPGMPVNFISQGPGDGPSW